jgi:uncharacterized protein (TIGR02246 family)
MVVGVAACSPARAPSAGLTAADSSGVAAVRDRYVQAWLADDTAAVLALFEPGGMVLPPGQRAIVGHDAIRDYWWPRDGSTTKILAFRWTPLELRGEGSLAVVRGESIVSWEYAKGGTATRDSSVSVNVTVLERSPDAGWRIAWQMWGPALK